MDKAKVTPYQAAQEMVESPMWFIREVLVKHQTTVMEAMKELADENKRLKNREWVGLTNEEREYLWAVTPIEDQDRFAFVMAVEAKLKEKNT